MLKLGQIRLGESSECDGGCSNMLSAECDGGCKWTCAAGCRIMSKDQEGE